MMEGRLYVCLLFDHKQIDLYDPHQVIRYEMHWCLYVSLFFYHVLNDWLLWNGLHRQSIKVFQWELMSDFRSKVKWNPCFEEKFEEADKLPFYYIVVVVLLILYTFIPFYALISTNFESFILIIFAYTSDIPFTTDKYFSLFDHHILF